MKTGNVKQVANFEQLVSMATALGAGYNPAKSSFKLPALTTLLTQANQSLQSMKTAETKYINATNARAAAFAGIEKLTTRMIHALATTDASEEMVENAVMIKQRISGSKTVKSGARHHRTADNSGSTTAMEDPPVPRSHGGKDFDNAAMLFGKLVDLMASEPSYKPNETDLQVATLTTLSTTLRDRNLAVTNALAALRMARVSRNAVLYKDGIYKTAKLVKRYVKSAYGARSEQFASIGGLEFKRK